MQLLISSDDINLRIDKFLRKKLKNAPLSLVFKLLRSKLKVNGKKVEPSYRIKDKDILELKVKEKEFNELTSYDFKIVQKKPSFNVLYEDDELLIVDKPSGLASHSGTGVMENNLMDQVFSYLGKKNVALVNRLDRETSGIVIIGKNMQAVRKLNAMIKERKVKKYYLALVKGSFPKKQGNLKAYLKRVKEDFEHRMEVSSESDPDAQLAELNYKVIEEKNGTSLLEIELLTGRMHQIRAQFSFDSHPLIGDKVYGDKELNTKLKIKRLFLHAYKVVLNHPVTNKEMKLESPLPEELKKAFP